MTGPSGVGKGTVVKEILGNEKDFWLSISATTREPREGEKDGENYYFLNQEKFKEMIERNLFLEWAQFAGNYYGTHLSSVNEKIKMGFTVLLEIEVEGARQIKNKFPNSRSIFLLPPDKKELERRIRNRGTEKEEAIKKAKEINGDAIELEIKYGLSIVYIDTMLRDIRFERKIALRVKARPWLVDFSKKINSS